MKHIKLYEGFISDMDKKVEDRIAKIEQQINKLNHQKTEVTLQTQTESLSELTVVLQELIDEYDIDMKDNPFLKTSKEYDTMIAFSIYSNEDEASIWSDDIPLDEKLYGMLQRVNKKIKAMGMEMFLVYTANEHMPDGFYTMLDRMDFHMLSRDWTALSFDDVTKLVTKYKTALRKPAFSIGTLVFMDSGY